MEQSSSSPAPVRYPAKNPIALRVFKVLGANYGDEALRDSLEALTQFYNAGPGLSPNESNVTFVRKNLERDLQMKLESGSQKFLTAFEAVDQNLQLLEKCIEEMYTQCDEVESHLRNTSDACSSLLARANGLREDRRSVEVRHKIASRFIQHFTLANDEVEVLTSRETPVDRAFFAALARTERIKAECALLLREGPDESKAGFDIMSTCTTHLELGYQKLHQQLISDLRHLGIEPYPEVNPTLQRSVEHLGKRPELLQDFISALADIRQSTLMGGFIVALTRGGPGGIPRPIELHAHDPTRYTGDMLAWVHQTVAWEHEFLESLFGIKQNPRMMGSVRKPPEDLEGQEKLTWVARILDMAVQGLCKPLKFRVLQTVKSQEGSVIVYKITNLIRFYSSTMSRTIGEDTFLSRTLNELLQSSLQILFDILGAQGRSSLRFLHPPEANLSVPVFVISSTQNLRELMVVYETSLLGDEDEMQKKEDFRLILTETVEPLLEACHKMVELNSSKDASKDDWANHVFLLNCLSYIQEVLKPFSFAKEKVDQLDILLETHARQLMEQHYQSLLQESGLSSVVQAIQEADLKTPLSLTEACSPTAVSKALSSFADFLRSLDVISSPRLSLLTASRLQGSIHQDALRRLCLAYGAICEAVKNPSHKFEFASTLLGSHRPFGQMNTLRQLLGVPQPR